MLAQEGQGQGQGLVHGVGACDGASSRGGGASP